MKLQTTRNSTRNFSPHHAQLDYWRTLLTRYNFQAHSHGVLTEDDALACKDAVVRLQAKIDQLQEQLNREAIELRSKN